MAHNAQILTNMVGLHFMSINYKLIWSPWQSSLLKCPGVNVTRAIFGKKMAFFSEKTQCYVWSDFEKASSILNTICQSYPLVFGENILIIITLVPGVDVMITIFCDFANFSQKPMLWSNFCKKTRCSLSKKRQYFGFFFLSSSYMDRRRSQYFGKKFQQKYFNNHNIGPGNEIRPVLCQVNFTSLVVLTTRTLPWRKTKLNWSKVLQKVVRHTHVQREKVNEKNADSRTYIGGKRTW
jgi:hypothetical protein